MVLEESRFHWADYVVFAASLALSAGVGIYFGFVSRRQNTTEEFLMAGRKMAILPVSVSLFVSWMSAISFLADPVEAYTVGVIYWILGIGHALGIPLVAHFFAPYFHKLKLVSAYELLETKYNKGLRLFATSANISVIWLWLGIVLYAPALALSQSSGIPVWAAMVSINLVCIFYTTLGGMKAVLWTDALQMVIMLSGQLAVVIQGCLKVGGVYELFTILSKTGHNRIDNFDPNPTARASFWAFLIGGIARTFNAFVSNQMLVQRYCTVSTSKKATIAVYLTIPVYLLMATLFTATGLVMRAIYSGCDPLKQGRIVHQDQLVPLLVLDLLGFVPGIPGLFMACVFSAALSSLSSGLNSMSANTLKDFIEPAYFHFKKKELDDSRGTLIAKILVVVYGSMVLGMGFIMMLTKGSIFALTAKATGMVASPIAGIFVMAVFFPSVKGKSVTLGFILSLVLTLWLGIGAFFLPPPVSPEALAFTSQFCDTNATLSISSNISDVAMTTAASLTTEVPQMELMPKSFSVEDLYYLNPLYYGPLGCLGTTILSLIFHGLGVCFESLSKKTKAYALKDEKVKVEKDNHPSVECNRDMNLSAINNGFTPESEMQLQT